jgi:hypothetical protein
LSNIKVRIEKTWGGKDREWARGVVVGPDRDIYVTGFTDSFDGGASDAFIVKYDRHGKLIWQKTWGGRGAEWDEAWGVAVGPYGGIYVVGETTSFSAGGGRDVFVLKYNQRGKLIWQKVWRNRGSGGTRLSAFVKGVAVGSDENIYVVGATRDPRCRRLRSDAFILKFDPDAGDLRWQKGWGGNDLDPAWDVAVDKYGDIYVVGFTHSFGVHVPTPDVFILKYDSDGNLIWDKTWGANDLEDAQGVAAVDNKRFVVVGTTTSSIRRTLRDVRGRTSTPPGVENTLSQPDYTLFGDVITPNGREKKPIGEPSKGNGDAYLIYL